MPAEQARTVALVKAPSIGKLPDFDPLPDTLTGPVLLKVGNDISTDEIMPAGARALPYRSNIEKLADFAFTQIDPSYPERARDTGTHVVIGGSNYGQGSSREHAAIVPRYLGLRLVVAKSYARIHWQNLANFGVLALEFTDPADYDTISAGDQLTIANVRESLQNGQITLRNLNRDTVCHLHHRFTPRQINAILAGGLIPQLRAAKRKA